MLFVKVDKEHAITIAIFSVIYSILASIAKAITHLVSSFYGCLFDSGI